MKNSAITLPSIGNLTFYNPTQTNLLCGKADIPLGEIFIAIEKVVEQKHSGRMVHYPTYDLLIGTLLNQYFAIYDIGFTPLFIRSLQMAIPDFGGVISVDNHIPNISIANTAYSFVNLPHQYNAIVNIVLSAIYAADGVLFIRGIEHNLHHSLYQPLMLALDVISKECNVQVFATTQSRELVVAARNVHNDSDNYELTYYRLDKSDADIEAVRYGETTLGAAIEFDFEIR